MISWIHTTQHTKKLLHLFVNPLSTKFIKWSNTLKQIVGNLPTICLSVFDHFSGLAFKGLGKTKKAYYENLDEKKVSDNKLFWKTVKSSLSEKFNARERISLSKNGESVETQKGRAEVFNNFFGNIVKDLNISQYSDFDPTIENVKIQT